ncbi:MAG: hypothetical protein ACSLFQ_09050 [Thermoanaerobaculia bacterium]
MRRTLALGLFLAAAAPLGAGVMAHDARGAARLDAAPPGWWISGHTKAIRASRELERTDRTHRERLDLVRR